MRVFGSGERVYERWGRGGRHDLQARPDVAHMHTTSHGTITPSSGTSEGGGGGETYWQANQTLSRRNLTPRIRRAACFFLPASFDCPAFLFLRFANFLLPKSTVIVR